MASTYILSLIFVLIILVLKNGFKDEYYNEPVKFPMWAYLLGVLVFFIPVINVAVSAFATVFFLYYLHEYGKPNEDSKTGRFFGALINFFTRKF